MKTRNITVINWNIGGAKVLESKKQSERKTVMDKINDDLYNLIKKHKPHIVTLQEVVTFKQPSDPNVINILNKDRLDKLGYKYFFFPLIDSLGFSSQAKWRKIIFGKTIYNNIPKKQSDWHKHTYFAQGNAMLFKKNAPLFPFWDLSRPDEPTPGQRLKNMLYQQKKNPVSDLIREFDNDFQNYLIEHIHLEGGVYFGNRDTEPRAALVAHLIFHPVNKTDSKPIDIFVINVHLVTIMKERVGIPSTDTEAARLRINQLDDIFNRIISRYNSWFDDGFLQRGRKIKPAKGETYKRHQPVWLLCGDFNFTVDSDEYNYILRRNFIDTTPPSARIKTTTNPIGKGNIHHNGSKAKGAGNPASLNLDYIFAGPKFVAFDPLISNAGMGQNSIEHEIFSSDHYPVISTIPLFMVK